MYTENTEYTVYCITLMMMILKGGCLKSTVIDLLLLKQTKANIKWTLTEMTEKCKKYDYMYELIFSYMYASDTGYTVTCKQSSVNFDC